MSAWCPVLLLGAAFLLLAVAESTSLTRTKRLTAFGKTPTAETETKIPRGKECANDEACAALEYTTCKVDKDQRRRCLCHDLQAPNNGECEIKKRELHEGCTYDRECIKGAECKINSTVKANESRCYCRLGFQEENKECNSGHMLSAIASLVLFTSLALLTTQLN